MYLHALPWFQNLSILLMGLFLIAVGYMGIKSTRKQSRGILVLFGLWFIVLSYLVGNRASFVAFETKNALTTIQDSKCWKSIDDPLAQKVSSLQLGMFDQCCRKVVPTQVPTSSPTALATQTPSAMASQTPSTMASQTPSTMTTQEPSVSPVAESTPVEDSPLRALAEDPNDSPTDNGPGQPCLEIPDDCIDAEKSCYNDEDSYEYSKTKMTNDTCAQFVTCGDPANIEVFMFHFYNDYERIVMPVGYVFVSIAVVLGLGAVCSLYLAYLGNDKCESSGAQVVQLEMQDTY